MIFKFKDYFLNQIIIFYYCYYFRNFQFALKFTIIITTTIIIMINFI